MNDKLLYFIAVLAAISTLGYLVIEYDVNGSALFLIVFVIILTALSMEVEERS